jgi:hypothetical protein
MVVVQRKLASLSLYTTAPTSIRHKEESGRNIKKPHRKLPYIADGLLMYD